MVLKSAEFELVQFIVFAALPAAPLTAVAPLGEALSIVSAFGLVSLPVCMFGPAHAVTGAVMAYAPPAGAGIAACDNGVARTLKVRIPVPAVKPETVITLEPVTGDAVEPKTVFALSVIANKPMPALVERFTVTEVIASVPLFVCKVNKSTSVAAAPGAMVVAAGSEPVARVVVGAGATFAQSNQNGCEVIELTVSSTGLPVDAFHVERAVVAPPAAPL